MDTLNKYQIREYLRSFCERAGSQKKASRKLGISASYISQILAANDNHIHLETWRLLSKQLLPSEWQRIETHNFRTITRLCSDCQNYGLMRALVGYSGAGKTTALRYYAREHRNVFYVHCLEGMTQKEFIRELLTEMGIDAEGTRTQLIRRLTTEFLQLDRPLLLLDDAGKLGYNHLHKVQQLYDLTRDEAGGGNAGIVLAGVDYMYDNLARAARRERPGAPELKRRIGYKQDLKRPKRKEIEAIAQQNGIDDPGVLDVLARNCKDFGTLAEAIRNYQRLPQGSTPQDFEQTFNPAA
jgi:hypothetical protein